MQQCLYFSSHGYYLVCQFVFLYRFYSQKHVDSTAVILVAYNGADSGHLYASSRAVSYPASSLNSLLRCASYVALCVSVSRCQSLRSCDAVSTAITRQCRLYDVITDNTSLSACRVRPATCLKPEY